MAKLVDASLWIDFTRARTPHALRQLIAPHIFDPDTCLAEPIAFEVLRYANEQETRQFKTRFQTVPTLSTPANIWSDAADLGQRCRRHGVTAGALDLLIANVAMHHDAELVTFDADFERIATVSSLRVKRLQRPM